jgi:hypothetical protein
MPAICVYGALRTLNVESRSLKREETLRGP